MDVSQVIHIRSNEGRGCPFCKKHHLDGDAFDAAINHVLSHGFSLLHVGSETIGNKDEGIFLISVATLGK